MLAFCKTNKASFGLFTFQFNQTEVLTHYGLSANAGALTVMVIAFSLGSCLQNINIFTNFGL